MKNLPHALRNASALLAQLDLETIRLAIVCLTSSELAEWLHRQVKSRKNK